MGLGGLGAVRAGVAGGSAERLWDHDVSLQREAEGEDKEVRREGGRCWPFCHQHSHLCGE